jgi:hypothetical protein
MAISREEALAQLENIKTQALGVQGRIEEFSKTEDKVQDTTGSTGTTSAILQELSSRLLNQTGITSSDGGIQSVIDKSLARLTEAQEKSEAGLAAGAERLKGEAVERGEERLSSARELQRGVGPASAFALISKMEEATNKELKDLDLRYREAVASGQTALAEKISNLEIQAIQFKQQAQQQAFSNLINFASLSANMEAQRAQEESQKISNIYNSLQVAKSLDLEGMESSSKRALELQFNMPTGLLDKVAPDSAVSINEVDGVLVATTVGKDGKIKTDILYRTPKGEEVTAKNVKEVAVNYLSSRRDGDNKVSAEDYELVIKQYHMVGKTQADALKDLNVKEWLSPSEIEVLRKSGYYIPEDKDEALGNILNRYNTPGVKL